MVLRIWGVLCGGLVAWGAMAVLGVLHRYVFAPAMSPFGSPDLFLDMSWQGLLALIGARALAAFLGAGVASGVSHWRHAAWVGPAVVALCAVTTLVVADMGQPFWTLVASLVVVGLVGWWISRGWPQDRAGA